MSLVIALDGMGGDAAPEIVVSGAAGALARDPDLRFLLFGDEGRLAPLLDHEPALRAATEVRHTPDAITGDAKPATALRQGRSSSMRLTINAVKEGEAAAAVSAGNTGALLAMAKFVLKTLPGIDRPAFVTIMPARRKPTVILDLGANVDCTADHLFQFARVILGIEQPEVGLLNVGTEELKGDDIVRSAAAMLRDSPLKIRFHGFIEGNDVTEGVVDVVVTDGFTGNVALKIAEGTAKMFTSGLRDAFEQGGLRAKLGFLFARPALRSFRDKLDPRRYNGAMFVGLNGVVVKSHGGTDALGFASALGVAADLVRKRANERIMEELAGIAAATLPETRAAS